MLSRFVKMRGPIRKALIDLSEPTQVTDGDFCIIEEMVSCLEPVKIAVKAICRRDTNLIAAEAALHFCIIQLQKQSSELAKTLAEAIECRLKGRRTVHAGVLQYLQSNTARDTAPDVFPVPSNAVVRKFVQNMVKRLDYSEESSGSDSQSEDTATAAVLDPDPEEHRQESSSNSFAQQLEIIMRHQSLQLRRPYHKLQKLFMKVTRICWRQSRQKWRCMKALGNGVAVYSKFTNIFCHVHLHLLKQSVLFQPQGFYAPSFERAWMTAHSIHCVFCEVTTMNN